MLLCTRIQFKITRLKKIQKSFFRIYLQRENHFFGITDISNISKKNIEYSNAKTFLIFASPIMQCSPLVQKILMNAINSDVLRGVEVLTPEF